VGGIGVTWPFRGSGSAGTLALVIFLLATIATVPLGWWLICRRFGHRSAGPLWPLLAFVLLAGVYAVVTPPWQMPDEPQHVGHVELVRRVGVSDVESLLGAPRPGALRARAAVDAELVQSLRDTDLVRWEPGLTKELAQGKVPGPRELTHPPLYYVLGAAVTKPFQGAPLVARLAVLRALGIVLAAWTVWACGLVGRLLWPGRALAEAPLAIVVAIPTFVAYAGSANNDGLAALLGALMIVLLVAGVTNAPRLRPELWALGIAALAVAGVGTKRTFLPLLLLVPVAVAIRARTRVHAVLATVIVSQLVIGLAVVAFSQPRVAIWQGVSPHESYRCRGGRTGAWALCVSRRSGGLRQAVSLADLQDVTGSNVRFAMWARGSSTGSGLSVRLESDLGTVASRDAPISERWTSVETIGQVPDAASDLWVNINPSGPGVVRVDDVEVTPVDTPAGTPGDGLAAGSISGARRNLLANGSGTQAVRSAAWPLPTSVQRAFNSGVAAAASVVLEPSRVLASTGIIWDHATTTFATFWATAGWPIPPQLFPAVLRWLLGLLVLVAVGGVMTGWLRAAWRPGFGVVVAGAVVAVAAVVLRNMPPDDSAVVSGRYLFPGLVAITAVLAAGWRQLWPNDDRSFRRLTRLLVPAMHALFIAFVLVPFLAR